MKKWKRKRQGLLPGAAPSCLPSGHPCRPPSELALSWAAVGARVVLGCRRSSPRLELAHPARARPDPSSPTPLPRRPSSPALSPAATSSPDPRPPLPKLARLAGACSAPDCACPDSEVTTGVGGWRRCPWTGWRLELRDDVDFFNMIFYFY
jgi:hypothetical protein